MYLQILTGYNFINLDCTDIHIPIVQTSFVYNFTYRSVCLSLQLELPHAGTRGIDCRASALTIGALALTAVTSPKARVRLAGLMTEINSKLIL